MQAARGAAATGYLNGEQAERLRAAGASPPSVSGNSEPPAAPVIEPPAAPPEVVTDALLATSDGTTPQAAAELPAGLPPEILVDRHLVRFERLLAAGEPGAAIEVMDEILSLREDHDLVLEDEFRFRHAQAAFAAGLTETAITSLNEYLLAAGRDGEFYCEALELLDSADVRLQREQARFEREEANRRRLARWPARVFRDCDVCPEMMVLPDGRLAMGRYEVTVGEYRAFAAATEGEGDCDFGGSWRDPGFLQTDRHPVTCVSWDDAQAYVSWLSRTAGATYRLPTEAEWERAAAGSQRGCDQTRTGRRGTCPVGSYGANGVGLFDMVGNVSE